MNTSKYYRNERREVRGRLWVKALCGVCISAVMVLGAIALFAGMAGKAFAEARVEADFNGDGFDDLAIGVPFEDIGNIEDAGAVNVIYGSAGGLTSAGDQLWHQNSTGILDSAEVDDLFGSFIAAGDFDGDGFDDLAIGVHPENLGVIQNNAGAVNVIYGSAGGLTSAGNQFWHQDISGISDSAEADDIFGSSLTAGDFDGDGFDDLAIGVGFETIESKVGAGAVNVIYGSASGLTATGDQFWHQDTLGIVDTAEDSDAFGSSLTAGDFDGDGFDDIAVGVPSETIVEFSGAVNVIYGSASGLTSAGNQLWHQDTLGIVDTAEAGDLFGSSLTAGNFDGDEFDDLAVGVLFEGIGGIESAGAVNVIYGSASGLTATGDQFWHQNSTGIKDIVAEGDRFGRTLSTGDFDGDGFDDLAVGVFDEDIGGTEKENAGAINVIYGSTSGLTATGDQFWHQDRFGIMDTAEAGDNFGSCLTTGDFDGDGFDDLAVGISGEDIGSLENAGAVNVIYGISGSGLNSAGDQFWHQNSAGILDVAQTDDFFGFSLSN